MWKLSQTNPLFPSWFWSWCFIKTTENQPTQQASLPLEFFEKGILACRPSAPEEPPTDFTVAPLATLPRSSAPFQRSFSSTRCLDVLVLAILTGVRWKFKVVFICISQVTKDIKLSGNVFQLFVFPILSYILVMYRVLKLGCFADIQLSFCIFKPLSHT